LKKLKNIKVFWKKKDEKGRAKMKEWDGWSMPGYRWTCAKISGPLFFSSLTKFNFCLSSLIIRFIDYSAIPFLI